MEKKLEIIRTVKKNTNSVSESEPSETLQEESEKGAVSSVAAKLPYKNRFTNLESDKYSVSSIQSAFMGTVYGNSDRFNEWSKVKKITNASNDYPYSFRPRKISL